MRGVSDGMNCALRSLVAILAVLCSTLPGRAAQDSPLERGTAITDPLALRELDGGRFGLGAMLAPARSSNMPLDNRDLFALASMAPVRKALDDEFEKYIARHRSDLPNETIGVGASFDLQLFDRALLYSPDSRFVLAGIVNRMDRAWLDQRHCGEIRLIYRLTRTAAPDIADAAASPRLPMTLNIVLKAKGDVASNAGTEAITCASIARRWLTAGNLQLHGAELAQKLTGSDGPLNLILSENIARIETNLQVAHAPKTPARDFRTDYLMKVFDYNGPSAVFVEASLENQIDRDRLLGDEKLRSEFKKWLLDPERITELDRGTILIPDRFLARAAVAGTRSDSHGRICSRPLAWSRKMKRAIRYCPVTTLSPRWRKRKNGERCETFARLPVSSGD